MDINSLILVPLVVLLDAYFGEPRYYHPLIGFGTLAQQIEKKLNNDSVVLGVIGWMVLVLPLVSLTWFLSSLFGVWFDVLIAYLALGARSLWQHSQQVYVALEANNLELARKRVAWIVSRDTAHLTEEELSKATVESLLENGSDAIFATLFWFIVAGAEGAMLYRLSNTLDAMWGYRSTRYQFYGYFTAKVDDVLNWIPARLTALSYAVFGDFKTAWHCWKTQGNQWYSPNAGPVMAAGAGALNLTLGGAAIYNGQLKQRLDLGKGDTAKAKDINRAWKMIQQSLLLWCLIAFFLGLSFYVYSL
ncbi:MAG: cobalamin biosynthesis protein [Cocleimonas sp.]|nr:cobalamin biosynthesis protein [Cocleimonas sp.]